MGREITNVKAGMVVPVKYGKLFKRRCTVGMGIIDHTVTTMFHLHHHRDEQRGSAAEG